MNARAKSSSPRALADLFTADPDAAVVRVLKEAGRALNATEVKKALVDAGLPKNAVDLAWPAVQRRLKTHDGVLAEAGRYRWKAASESGQADPFAAFSTGPDDLFSTAGRPGDPSPAAPQPRDATEPAGSGHRAGTSEPAGSGHRAGTSQPAGPDNRAGSSEPGGSGHRAGTSQPAGPDNRAGSSELAADHGIDQHAAEHQTTGPHQTLTKPTGPDTTSKQDSPPKRAAGGKAPQTARTVVFKPPPTVEFLAPPADDEIDELDEIDEARTLAAEPTSAEPAALRTHVSATTTSERTPVAGAGGATVAGKTDVVSATRALELLLSGELPAAQKAALAEVIFAALSAQEEGAATSPQLPEPRSTQEPQGKPSQQLAGPGFAQGPEHKPAQQLRGLGSMQEPYGKHAQQLSGTSSTPEPRQQLSVTASAQTPDTPAQRLFEPGSAQEPQHASPQRPPATGSTREAQHKPAQPQEQTRGQEAARDTAQSPGQDASRDTAQSPGRGAARDTAQGPGQEASRDTAQSRGQETNRDTAQSPGQETNRDTAQGPGQEASRDTAYGAGQAVELGEDAEAAARQRQAEIDSIRRLAELASEVEELIANETAGPVMIRQVRAWVKRNGLDPVGQAGEETKFDRKQHKPIGGRIHDGASVIVVRPGYIWRTQDEDVLLGKAVVEE